MKPVVVILGRPNVGKSTFFNVLVGAPKAIVEDLPGVTRDLNYAEVAWEGTEFRLVDSGGYETDRADAIAREVREQIRFAMAEADLILFLMDGRTDPTPVDAEVADLLRRQTTPFLLVANKVDNEKLEWGLAEHRRPGADVYPVSSKNRRGLRDLMDAVLARLPTPTPEPADDGTRPCRIAIVGRPNVGKSSLVNAVVGGKRVIVTDVPGTTRDDIDVPFEFGGSSYVLVDTAGIRRKAKVKYRVETYGVVRSLRALDLCDVALVVLDGSEPIAEQDERIAGYAHERGRGVILVVNKWDLAPRGLQAMRAYERDLRDRMSYLGYAPVLFTSAKDGKGIDKVLRAVGQVRQNRARRIATGVLNQWLAKASEEHSPPIHHGRRVKIFYITQTHVGPPTFVAFVNYPDAIHFSYERYLSNRLRELGDFEGSPIWLKFRKRSEDRFPDERKKRRGKG
jgi:GTP-binding protein